MTEKQWIKWLKQNNTIRYDCIYAEGQRIMNKIGKGNFICSMIGPSKVWITAGAETRWITYMMYKLKPEYNINERTDSMTEFQLYQKMQTDWVRENNVKVGGTVRVAVKVPGNHLGWGNDWVSPMNAMVNERFKITHISNGSIVVNGYYFSFMSLADYKPSQDVEVRYYSGGKDITGELTDKSKKAIAKANS